LYVCGIIFLKEAAPLYLRKGDQKSQKIKKNMTNQPFVRLAFRAQRADLEKNWI